MTIVFIAADIFNVGAGGLDIRYAYAITGKPEHYFVYGSIKYLPFQMNQANEERYKDYLFVGVLAQFEAYYQEHNELPNDLSVTFEMSDFDWTMHAPFSWKGYHLELPNGQIMVSKDSFNLNS